MRFPVIGKVSTALPKQGAHRGSVEPAAVPEVAAGMSAQLRPGAAPPPRVAHARPVRQHQPSPADPGEVAFDRWLKKELGRLYDATLAEPVPEELTRLLDSATRKASTTG